MRMSFVSKFKSLGSYHDTNLSIISLEPVYSVDFGQMAQYSYLIET